MKVHIYEDEIRDRVEAIVKPPHNAPNVKFLGIQFFFGDPVIHTPGDDDSSAVTFWVNGPVSRRDLRAALVKAIELLDSPENAT